jgi:hypothetical protein
MRQKLFILISSLSIVTLSACSLNPVKKESPEEMIKNTQTNVIKAFKSTAIAKQNVDFQANIDASLSTPMWWWKVKLSLAGKSLWYTWDVNLFLNWNFDVKAPKVLSWNIDTSIDLKTTLKNIYIKLSKLDINVSDPQLAMYTAMAKMIENKWIYIENKANPQDIMVYKNLDLEKIFKNNTIFKVNKVLKDNEFEVSLNKDSLAKIIYNAWKQLDKTFSGNIDDIKKDLQNGDIIGNLKIWDDKYFEFSGNIISSVNKNSVPLLIIYTKNKYKISLSDLFVVDLDRNWDKFTGKINFKNWPTGALTLPISGLLNQNEFKLEVSYNQMPINAKVTFDYKINKEIKKLDLQLPSSAVSIEELFWWFGPAIGK